MAKQVLLCADAQSCANPSLVGLEGESLSLNAWITCANAAQECRKAACGNNVDEVWVVSCDDMESINVAAAIKQDNPAKPVFLLAADPNGSLASRAATARIDGVWSQAGLVRRYAERKKEACDVQAMGLALSGAVAAPGAAAPKSGSDTPLDAVSGLAPHPVASPGSAASPGTQAGLASGSVAASHVSPAAPVQMSGSAALATPVCAAPPSLKSSGFAAVQVGGQGLAPALSAGPFSNAGFGPSGALGALAAATSAPAAQVSSPCPSPSSASPCPVPPVPAAPTAVLPAVAKRASAQVRASAKDATVIAVISGSGGCGKSTIAALFALMASRAEGSLDVAVIDADLQFGDMDQLLNAKDPVRIEDAMEEPAMLSRLKEASKKGEPALLAAPRRLEAAEAVVGFLPEAIAAVGAAFDVVIINTGSFWSEVHAVVLEAADAVAFVVDQRPSSLRATVHAVELCSRLGIATSGFVFAVNRHEKSSLLSAMDVSCALRGAHAMELPNGGREVDELLGAGYAQELIDSKNPFAAAVRDLLLRLLPAERRNVLAGQGAASSKRKRGLFGKGGAS